MDGFKKKREQQVPATTASLNQPFSDESNNERKTDEPDQAAEEEKRLEKESITVKNPKKWLKWTILGAAVLLLAGGVLVWYQNGLRPACTIYPGESVAIQCPKQDFTVQGGESVSKIADGLEAANLIQNAGAFKIHAKLSGKSSSIKTGVYELSPTMSAPEILDKLTTEPDARVFRVTFLPGGTLADAKKALLKVTNHRNQVVYSEAEIDAAFAKRYDNPVLQDKPAEADLEGYIYGDTYEFYEGVPVETIIERVLKEMEQVVDDGNLAVKFKAQGLNLYQGITLASIVQREGGGDLPEVASVFLNRLNAGMTLGSDVTYQYIADKLGVERDPALDNPYNTRVYPGLPPGPISSPGKSALLAVADPAKTDYIYFLSGDDGKTYFAKTEAEHNKNIRDHCQEKCLIL
ncbi:MAG: endolytic transglycosylase MltG [Candidatus Nomurabacteria bacterium]|jgi:UPF0755 protein|nr:endolytic transglycosylase MltG [Candidatus Nomurabacteria bacterium]